MSGKPVQWPEKAVKTRNPAPSHLSRRLLSCFVRKLCRKQGKACRVNLKPLRVSVPPAVRLCMLYSRVELRIFRGIRAGLHADNKHATRACIRTPEERAHCLPTPNTLYTPRIINPKRLVSKMTRSTKKSRR